MSPDPTQAVTVAGARDEEAIAVIAAVEQFMRDSALPLAPQAPEPAVSPWKRAALLEGVSRQTAQ